MYSLSSARQAVCLGALLVSLALAGCDNNGGTAAQDPPPPANQPPTVDAGSAQTVDEGAAVTLAGTAQDADGTIAGVQWTQNAGPAVTLVNSTTLSAGFTAPQVAADSDLTFQLRATDDDGAQAADTVTIRVRNVPPPNQAPAADAGADRTVDEGSAVTLQGGGTDVDGTVAGFAWSQVTGPTVALNNPGTATPSFVAPLVDADTALTFRLVVTDDDGAASPPDTVTITIDDLGGGGNLAPTANAGPDQSANEGTTVTLDGSGTDADGTIAAFRWTQTAGPAVPLSNADAQRPTFTAPQVDDATALTFELVVTDDDGEASAADAVTIVVEDTTTNSPPTANAGPDQDVDEGANVALAGSGADSDGTIASFHWTQTAGPAVTLSNPDVAAPTFAAPAVEGTIVLTFALVVTDDDGTASAADSVSITVRDVPANDPPAANAGPDQTVDEGAAVSLPGGGSDSDGTVTAYAWTQTAGPAVTLANADTATASFTAPQVDGAALLRFRLTVTDDDGANATDDVEVTVNDTVAFVAPDPVALAQAALEAQLRGCDVLDTAQCLLPFPSNLFTAAAGDGSPQSAARGGTGIRVNFNPLAPPRNIAGKPIDVTEWNRQDGFSPGALLATFVPGLSLERTFNLPAPDIGIANLALSQDPDSPILVLEVPRAPEAGAPRRHLVWAELDANADLLVRPEGNEVPQPSAGRAALLIRPAKNFSEGRRYVAVLRRLRDADGRPLAAQDAFTDCRDQLNTLPAPALTARCATLERDVFPVLEAAGIARDRSLYLAWDFTVGSTQNQVGRLRHMRDDAFASLASDEGADCVEHHDGDACNAPVFSVDRITVSPQSGIARRIEGTLRVPSYVVPADPAPSDNPSLALVLQQLQAVLPDQFGALFDALGLAGTASLPPNRLNYDPTDAPQTEPANLRYGDGLPDRSGEMTVPYTCQIPERATADDPARAGVYGHGLLDSRNAVTYDGVPELSREFNYMFCAVDWFGFATGDLPNVATVLADLSNFPVIPDGSQQGMVNFMYLARLLKHPHGFASSPAFQDTASQRPLYDRSNVFYDGNSQGGILGGVLLAASRDIQRGVLGSLGMNYSTLLQRSVDFDLYAVPLYLAYQEPLDRQLAFSMMQMLWDRSENNGYAAHLTDNSAFGGAPKIAKLDPQFGDHQVTMWSADVMARTMGIPADHGLNRRVATVKQQPRRHPDVTPHFGQAGLDYGNPAQTSAGALVLWDDARSEIPPIANTPPRAGRDPHDDSAKKFSGRCQKAHFLREGGVLVDVEAIEFDGGECAPIPPVPPTVPTAAPVAAQDTGAAVAGLAGGLAEALAALLGGDFEQALAILQGSVSQFAADAITVATGVAGDLAGTRLPPPSPPATPGNPSPQPLLAGIAKGAMRVPVGTPLGGYLRPPVGGEYIPGLEGFAAGDPSVFFAEFLDFLPTGQDHDGEPLAPLPDELRTIHSPYATFAPPSRGYYDSLVTKVVALYDGHDYVVLVKTDMIGMIDEVVTEVKRQVKADTGIDLKDGLVMSGTHSHDGPGALANHSTRYFWLAMDAYQPELFTRLVPQLAALVKRALADMKPARFGYGMGREGYDHPVEGRKHLNSFRRSRLPGYDVAANDALRERIGVLRVDSADGEPLAAIINYAAHGIAFDVENLYFSGDVLGAAERATEALLHLPLAMLVQNTGGDVSPRADGAPKLQRIERFGRLLAPQVAQIYRGITGMDGQPDLRAVSQRVILSRERLGYADGEYPYPWGAAQCFGIDGIPPEAPVECLAAPPPDPADLADNGVAENGAFVPQDTHMTAVKIGSAIILAQPGEPLTEYGVRLLGIAGSVGYAPQDTFIWGYSQDHVGYILAPEEADWQMGGTEGTTTFWGWKQGQRLLDASRALMVALRDGTAAPVDEFTADYWYQDLYALANPPPVLPSARPGRVVTEPSSIARFEQTAFAFEGGDPVVDLPTVALQRLDESGQWQVARRANGDPIDDFFEMHLDYRLLSGAHVWTVTFEAPRDWAAGRYRFSVSGTARGAGDQPYVLSSQPFDVRPSATLVASASAPVRVGGEVEVTLAYTPRPDNYRLIDALVAAEHAAPVRDGAVAFTNGTQTSIDFRPDVEVRGGQIVAVYRAGIEGEVTVSGVDIFGNSTPVVVPPVGEVDTGTGAITLLAGFFSGLGEVFTTALAGDFALAGTQFQDRLAALVAGFGDLFGGTDASVLALFQNAAANIASGNVPGLFEQAGNDGGAVIGLDADPVTVVQRAGSANRNATAVVVTGAQLPGWSQPPAQGTPYPYPSGATTTGGFFPIDELSDKRSAHNGAMLYPAGSTPGDAPSGLPTAAPVSEIAAFARRGDAWVEIPVQVDEKYPYFLANANSDFSIYSGTDEELTYAWDLERWNLADSADQCTAVAPVGTPDPVAGLDDDDEVAFMWDDAGEFALPGTAAPAGATGPMQQVGLLDPLDPSSQKFVYLVRKAGGSSFKGAHYVRYQRDANADQWIDRGFFADDDPEKIGTSNTGYGPNLSGTVCPSGQKRQSSDRFPRDGVTVTTDVYKWTATGRWMVRGVQVARPGQAGVYGPDLVDRWKGRAFQQSPDSNISVVGFEDEQVNWEANSALLGERCGPVRCMREVWGADSGTNVTKLETFYRDAIAYRYHVRVHPIPPDGLYTSWDYNRSAMVPGPGENVPGGRYFTVLRPQGVPVDGINDDIGQADGFSPIPTPDGPLCVGSDGPTTPGANGLCRAFFDAADPTFNLALAFDNWEQVSGKGDNGSLVYTFELKGATSLLNPLVVPYYRDDACLDDGTGDDPVQRPWPGESYTWSNNAVERAYNSRAGRSLDYSGHVRADCLQRQGAHAAHGVHYFLTHDSDNAFILGKPNTEIDGQQWQFMVPTSRPVNVGELYSNNVRVPIVPIVTPLPPQP